jgi:hypothetical protein
MEVDSKFVAELWETVKDFVPLAKREDVATSFLEVFLDHDVEIEDLDLLKGADDSLDAALDELYGDTEDFEED